MIVADGKVLATGTSFELFRGRDAGTDVVDLAGRKVTPGLNDCHLHLIRGGLHYNLELRWERTGNETHASVSTPATSKRLRPVALTASRAELSSQAFMLRRSIAIASGIPAWTCGNKGPL
jgi:predicted amidohydrolase YtcJ